MVTYDGFDGPCFVQPLVDGVRVLAYWRHLDTGPKELWSRKPRITLVDMAGACWRPGPIIRQLKGQFTTFGKRGPLGGSILDGWLVLPDRPARDVYSVTGRRYATLEFHIADVWTPMPGGWGQRTAGKRKPCDRSKTPIPGLIERCVGGPIKAVDTVAVNDLTLVRLPGKSLVLRPAGASYFDKGAIQVIK